MFEDALFGHVRGAFTGAMYDTQGFLREADGGTVFMDEVSALSPALQAKLLRAIETGVFRPVGAKLDARSEFRVLAATNERLGGLVDDGRFRADFAQRIGAVTVEVPGLLDRLEDLPALSRHFLDRGGAGHVRVSDDALEALASHDWPGNVRELKHVVEWAAAFCDGKMSGEIVRSALAQRAAVGGLGRADAGALERKELKELLERFSWDTDAAARHLGLHRATLYRRMKRVGLGAP